MPFNQNKKIWKKAINATNPLKMPAQINYKIKGEKDPINLQRLQV